MRPRSFAIRQARVEEVAALGTIEMCAGKLFENTDIPGLNNEVFPPDELRDLITNGQVWVAAVDDDEPVGFVILQVIDSCAHVEELDVLPEFGRQGIGSALLEHACRQAAEQGLSCVTLSTFRDVPWNAPFYMKHSFEICDPQHLSPAMLELRAIERSKGLPINLRVIMRRQLIPEPGT